MKYTILTAAIVIASASDTCHAQFNFKGTLKQIGGQVQRQVSSQVQREVQRRAPQVVNQVVRHVQKPKHTTLPYPPAPAPKPIVKPLPHPLPQPKPCPKPIITPLPHPKPCPKPIVTPLPYPYPTPEPITCTIKPCPTPRPVTCKIKPCPTPRPITCTIKPCPTPVEPEPAPGEELPQVASGQQVTIDGQQFGSAPGTVAVRIGDLTLEATVTAWTSTQATAILPELPMAESTRATVVIITAYGNIADSLDVELLPPSADSRAAETTDESELPVVSPGQEVTLEAGGMGTTPGKVQLQVGGLTLNATVTAWSPTEVSAVLPQLSFAEAVEARIRVLTADGQVADLVDVLLAPAAEVATR